MPMIYPNCSKDMPKICPRYAHDMPKICPWYAQDIHKISDTRVSLVGLLGLVGLIGPVGRVSLVSLVGLVGLVSPVLKLLRKPANNFEWAAHYGLEEKSTTCKSIQSINRSTISRDETLQICCKTLLSSCGVSTTYCRGFLIQISAQATTYISFNWHVQQLELVQFKASGTSFYCHIKVMIVGWKTYFSESF